MYTGKNLISKDDYIIKSSYKLFPIKKQKPTINTFKQH